MRRFGRKKKQSHDQSMNIEYLICFINSLFKEIQAYALRWPGFMLNSKVKNGNFQKYVKHRRHLHKHKSLLGFKQTDQTCLIQNA